MGLNRAGLRLHHGFEHLDRFKGISLGKVKLTDISLGGSVLGVKSERLLECLEGFVVFIILKIGCCSQDGVLSQLSALVTRILTYHCQRVVAGVK